MSDQRTSDCDPPARLVAFELHSVAFSSLSPECLWPRSFLCFCAPRRLVGMFRKMCGKRMPTIASKQKKNTCLTSPPIKLGRPFTHWWTYIHRIGSYCEPQEGQTEGWIYIEGGGSGCHDSSGGQDSQMHTECTILRKSSRSTENDDRYS